MAAFEPFVHDALLVALHFAVIAPFLLRVMLHERTETPARVAWVAVLVSFPLFGVLANAIFGNVSVGRRRSKRLLEVEKALPPLALPEDGVQAAWTDDVPEEYEHLFRLGQSICEMPPVDGNQSTLFEGSDEAIDAMAADIDAATDHVHLTTYIWLTDNSGLKVAEALKRAARRGVICRAIADDIGSMRMIRSEHWKDMRAAGVRLTSALPIGNPLLRMFRRRLDLRNHRKLLVIDDRITYCGSRNLADAEFRIKPRFAPWVDIVMRVEGPVARQNQHLFVEDWMVQVDEDPSDVLRRPFPHRTEGFVAQVIGSGPTDRRSAIPELFETLMHTARRELVVTTPYYLPAESIQSALRAAAYRGVDTTLVVPARNDSWVVGGASRSYYLTLLEAGVKIFEYQEGLLHAKTLTLDGAATMLGSTNLDPRSFRLNFENNLLFCDRPMTEAVRARQRLYVAKSRAVTLEEVRSWSVGRRLWQNGLAMLGPLL
ncbi:MAG TPA: cardiolipin synthase [Pirellulaceae bacterium]|jgi:cardiolipin synthase|nr:cardiolipin synthase [Pirellulaceae bacterium]